MKDGCDERQPAEIACDCEPCPNTPKAYRSTKEWVSCYPAWPDCAKGTGYATSSVSQQLADEEALELAKEDAAKRLGVKLRITAMLQQSLVTENDSFQFVAPLGTNDIAAKWEGRAAKKPWEYRVTAAIPHLETIEPLLMAIEVLRAQSERPYIIVVDTGSSPKIKRELESFRAEDLEIHYLMSNSWRHSSEPVTAALDLVQSICKTEYLFHTHSDCFLRRFDLLDQWASICSEKNPAVGYRMSPRDWISNEWEWMVGHTALMLHMPTISRIGASWSMQKMNSVHLYPWKTDKPGWPDTEIGFNNDLRSHGIKPIFLGYDRNYERQVDDNLDHARSFPGASIYSMGSEIYERARKGIVAAMRDANDRIMLQASLSHPSHPIHNSFLLRGVGEASLAPVQYASH